MRQLFYSLLFLLTGIAIGYFMGRTPRADSTGVAPEIGIARATGKEAAKREAAADAELVSVPEGVERGRATTTAPSNLSTPTEIEAALLELTARFPGPKGSEILAGRVQDENGRPIEGATVLVTGPSPDKELTILARSAADVGRAHDGERRLDPSGVFYAEAILRSLAPAGSSVTGADGRFAVEGLARGTYQVEVLAEDFVFDRVAGGTGETLEVFGKSVVSFELQVLDESGAPPELATIVVHGSGGADQHFLWTPDAAELRVTSRLVTLQAFLGEFARIGQGEYRADARSSLRTLDRDVDGRGPHVLLLQAFPSVHVDVVAGPDAGLPFEPWCDLVRGEQRIVGQRRPGQPFSLFDVTPGPYTVEVGRGDGPPEVTREISVDTGRVEVSVELGSLDPKRYLVVHCVDAEGRPVQDIRYFSFNIGVGSSRTGSLILAKARPNGEYWLSRERGGMGGKVIARTSMTSLTLQAESASQGKIHREVDPEAERIELVFQTTCELVVDVDGVLRPGLRVTVETPKDGGTGWSRNQPSNVPGDGSVAFRSLAPGKARVVLSHEDSPHRLPLAAVPVELREGRNVVRITAPEFHDLVVLVPDLEDQRFELLADEDGEFVRTLQQEPDENGRLTFKYLPPGRYRVQYRGRFRTIFADYVVPCGEVVFEPLPIEGFEVISVSEGSVSEKAGLRVGDVLLGVDHIDPSHEAFLFEYTARVSRAEGTVLRIRRAGSVVDLPVRLDDPPTQRTLGMGAKFKALGE